MQKGSCPCSECLCYFIRLTEVLVRFLCWCLVRSVTLYQISQDHLSAYFQLYVSLCVTVLKGKDIKIWKKMYK